MNCCMVSCDEKLLPGCVIANPVSAYPKVASFYIADLQSMIGVTKILLTQKDLTICNMYLNEAMSLRLGLQQGKYDTQKHSCDLY